MNPLRVKVLTGRRDQGARPHLHFANAKCLSNPFVGQSIIEGSFNKEAISFIVDLVVGDFSPRGIFHCKIHRFYQCSRLDWDVIIA